MSTAGARFAVCREDELPPGGRVIATVDGIEVGVFNLGDRVVAYRNICPHMGAPVCVGRVGGTTLPSEPGEYVYGRHGKVLHCPWHGWQFDLETGEAYGHRGRLARVRAAVEEGEVAVYVPRKTESREPAVADPGAQR